MLLALYMLHHKAPGCHIRGWFAVKDLFIWLGVEGAQVWCDILPVGVVEGEGLKKHLIEIEEHR